ncbi:DUF5689 domain-containing protein [Bergeyella zoohelcum]|uniref:DUF5689 domain-containing protein n=1 Tax=Bergeyella zoohelcum TaxID=1015 RepID=A0A7Z8YP35_9FLAO|nr:DUF5689 domain-containing protein [Bergeyella zoohelcum]VDH03537.1 Uncharacterised protein [Bergeyella zoohelcum]
MLKNTLLKISACALIVTATLTSCVQKDEWDIPPMNCENRFSEPTKTIQEVINMAPSSGSTMIPNGPNDPEIIIEGFVVSSDENGNFYKSISIQDAPENPTAGISIEVNKTSIYRDLPVGAKIRVRLNGLVIGFDRGSYKIGAVDPTYAIGRIPEVLMSKYISGVCNGNGLDVREIVPLELPNLAEAKKAKYINRLVKVKNVMFAESELGKTFVDYANGVLSDTDRTLEDFNNGTAVLRNSGYFRDGKTLLPEGSGEISFVVGRYNSNFQMQIRSINDILFTNPRPNFIFTDNFSANNLNKWTAVSVTGTQTWRVGSYQGNYYATINGQQGSTKYDNEDWLISNEIQLPTSLSGASLSFDNDARYGNTPLELFVTTQYTGDPATTTWVPLSGVNWDTNDAAYGYVNSGNISLSSFIGQNIRIAFKYTSTTTSTSLWQIDNVKVQEL